MGDFFDVGGGDTGAFVYDGARFTFASAPGAETTRFSDIYDAGLIAGHFGVEGPAGLTWTAFIYDGLSYSTFAVPGATGTFARGINAQGVVVGDFFRPGDEAEAYIYDGTSFTLVNAPGADATVFSDINDAGLITGFFGVNGPGGKTWTAFTFDGSSYSTFSVSGAMGTFARGVNTSGVVVGEFFRTPGSDTQAFLATPVPEPSPAALLLIGLTAVAYRLGGMPRAGHSG